MMMVVDMNIDQQLDDIIDVIYESVFINFRWLNYYEFQDCMEDSFEFQIFF